MRNGRWPGGSSSWGSSPQGFEFLNKKCITSFPNIYIIMSQVEDSRKDPQDRIRGRSRWRWRRRKREEDVAGSFSAGWYTEKRVFFSNWITLSFANLSDALLPWANSWWRRRGISPGSPRIAPPFLGQKQEQVLEIGGPVWKKNIYFHLPFVQVKVSRRRGDPGMLFLLFAWNQTSISKKIMNISSIDLALC